MISSVLYIIISLIGGWILCRFIYLKWKQKQYKKAFIETYKNTKITLPKFITGYNSNFVNFEVIYINKEQYKLAEHLGLNKIFETRIHKIHQKINNYKTNIIVYFSWETRTFNFSP